MDQPLRVMIYDRTCRGRGPLPGLTHTWWAGAWLYAALGRFDHWYGATSWDDALRWLTEIEPSRQLAETQFWGHGKWGNARIGTDILDASALATQHPLHGYLAAMRARLSSDSLWWFRTCETFGAEVGHAFACAWTDFLGCRAAGHTYIIGPLQSGLHSLRPGEQPRWPPEEGIREGTARAPRSARWSRPDAPHTITCLHGTIPPGY